MHSMGLKVAPGFNPCGGRRRRAAAAGQDGRETGSLLLRVAACLTAQPSPVPSDPNSATGRDEGGSASPAGSFLSRSQKYALLKQQLAVAAEFEDQLDIRMSLKLWLHTPCSNVPAMPPLWWTFALVSIYFGLGSLLSIYGCRKFISKVDCNRLGHMRFDAEHGAYVSPTNGANTNTFHRMKRFSSQQEHYMRPVAGFWGYAFQIIYQTNAGAVMLTDFAFWFIIVPFLTVKDYSLNFFMIGMHSVNAVFLLGDTALNSLRFPWFRISYFILWTAIYVIFQWVIHACIPIWWPYPFLDLSSSYAPIWYLTVAVLHIPCYSIFPLIIKMKHLLLSRCLPQSYQP